MANAKAVVREKHPQAEVVRSTFGHIVYADDTHSHPLSDGRAYWEEEAWVDAANGLDIRDAAKGMTHGR